MRTSKCIALTVLGTVLCLLHVFLQTEIVKFGYEINSASQILDTQKDKQTSLQFVLSSMQSPLNIDKSLSSDKDVYQLPDSFKLVKLSPAGSSVDSGMTAPDRAAPVLRRFAFSTFFTGRQAEARTIK